MPGGDRTGPEGRGFRRPGFRRIFQANDPNMNIGGRRFGGRWVDDAPAKYPIDEISELKSEVGALQNELVALNKRLETFLNQGDVAKQD